MTVAGPWPGPRPFGRDEGKYLFARDRDLTRVFGLIGGRAKVIELTAPSGVGKTSFLQAKLVPALEPKYDVVMCRDWAGASTGGGIELYRRVVLGQLTADVDDAKDNSADHRDQLVWETAEQLEQRSRPTVLVFDQVEELLRRDEELGLDFLAVVTQIARLSSVTQVISMRQEYKWSLRELEETLGPGTFRPAELQMIDDAFIPEVIHAPAAQFDLQISDAALGGTETHDNGIIDWWKQARAVQRRTRWLVAAEDAAEHAGVTALGGTAVGLLHLQALLWLLYRFLDRMSRNRPDLTAKGITTELLDAFRADAAATSNRWGEDNVGGRLPMTALIADALLTYVEESLTEGRPRGELAPYELTTITVAARLAPHLSSGGYKIPHDDRQLAALALNSDMTTLGIDIAEVGEAVRFLTDAVQAGKSRDEVLQSQDFGIDDETDLAPGRTSGRMAKCGRRAVARELSSAFLDAIGQLRKAQILREPPTLGHGRVYELVHDGFGPALAFWSREWLGHPATVIDTLTALRGPDVAQDEFSENVLGRSVIEFLNWHGCWVEPRQVDLLLIRDLEFRQADLRGTVFHNCEFRNVTFTECVLPGVIIQESRLINTTFNGCVIDGMTLRDNEGDDVTVKNSHSTEITLEAFQGQGWHIQDCRLSHLTITPAANSSFLAERCSLKRSLFAPSAGGSITLVDSDIWFSEFTSRDSETLVQIERCDLINSYVPPGLRCQFGEFTASELELQASELPKIVFGPRSGTASASVPLT